MTGETGARLRRAAPVLVLALLLGGLVVADVVSRRTTDRASAGPQTSTTASCRDDASDSAALQSVIDRSHVGDEIVIAGPCLLTDTVVLRGKRSYRGESVATTLTRAPDSPMPAMLVSDSWVDDTDYTGEPISLRDLTIDGNKDRNDDEGGSAVVIRSWSSQLENLHVRDAAGDGIVIAGSSRAGTRIDGGQTQVQGTIRDVDVVGSGRNGILVQDDGNAVTDWNLLDSWVGSSAGSGIRMENAAGWHVSGNHLYDNGQAGIWADRLFSTSIDDNIVEDFGADQVGIRVTVQDGAPSVISRNRVYQANADGGDTFIAVTGVAAGSGVLGVSDNVVRGNGTGTGLSYGEGPGRLRVTSTGNNVADVTTPVAGVTPVPSY